MTFRFVLEESSWTWASSAAEWLPQALEALIGRLATASERRERVAIHHDFYETTLGGDVTLYSLLFEADCPIELSKDLKLQLMLVLRNRANVPWSDDDLSSSVATFNGKTYPAKAVALAHGKRAKRQAVALLPLALQPNDWGEREVVVSGKSQSLHFVTNEQEHRAFFRDVVEIEDLQEDGLQALAPSAFPSLLWADDVWAGLKSFSQPYIAIRRDLVQCLGRLDDVGADIFFERQAGDPRLLTQHLSAEIGFETSDEDGKTKGNPKKRKDRTRKHEGVAKEFWWHVKLERHINRVHFLYEPASSQAKDAKGTLIIGIFKDHCL